MSKEQSKPTKRVPRQEEKPSVTSQSKSSSSAKKTTSKKESTQELGLSDLLPATGKLTPEFSSIWFDKDIAFASDGKVGMMISYESDLELGTPGEILIKMLNSAVGKVKLTQSGKHQLEVAFGKSLVKLPALESSRKVWGFPTAKPKGTTEISGDLLEAFSVVMLAKPGGKKPGIMHQGVIAIPGKNGWRLFATDSNVMAVATVNVDLPGDKAIIFPYPFVELMLKHGKDGDQIYVSSKYLGFFGGKASIFAGVIDASSLEVPKITGIIKTFNDDAGEDADLPAEFFKAMERAKTLAGNSKSDTIKIAGSGKELRITGDLTHGTVDETLPCSVDMSGAVVMDPAIVLRVPSSVKTISIVPKRGLIFGDEDLQLLVGAKK